LKQRVVTLIALLFAGSTGCALQPAPLEQPYQGITNSPSPSMWRPIIRPPGQGLALGETQEVLCGPPPVPGPPHPVQRGGMTTSVPDAFGRYDALGPAGSMTTSMPNGFGGYNTLGPNGNMTTSIPNGFGGYNTLGPNGSMTTSIPNGFGGYNIYRQ
jgi:hypothetical protein